jgi:hypothetical protein
MQYFRLTQRNIYEPYLSETGVYTDRNGREEK